MSYNGINADYVPTLVADAPHPAIDEYLKRPRGEWPPQDQLDEIQQLPLCLVLVGSKESDNPELEARASCSPAEILLISKLKNSIKQGFIAAKFTFKSAIKKFRGGNVPAHGRSHVGSYHLKTTLLHHLEKTPPSMINSPYRLMINILCDLQMYLKRGTLPHYFFQECNLLTTIRRDERQMAFKAIEDIVSNPVSAIIQCPTKPKEIYYDISPDDLAAAFSLFSADPSCVENRNDLFGLLSALDRFRLGVHCHQLTYEEGGRNRGPVRPDPTRLTDMLNKITHW